MSLKTCLILLTVVSVIADTMLLPFYPQFFQQAFQQSSPEHVGYYIAACCFTVMCAFPLWARVAKYIHELHLWVYTQIIAGTLGIACYFSTSLLEFWLLSQTMLVFKASYLLIYPFVMRLEDKDKHLGMVGLFSVLMHFGGISGALLGGFVLQYFDPRDIYLIMAASDGLQVMVCLYLILRFSVAFKPESLDDSKKEGSKTETSNLLIEPDDVSQAHRIKDFVFKLGLITALFYFSAFLIRPFFTQYWQSINSITLLNSDIVTGFIYSLPGWIAVIGLWINHKALSKKSSVKLTSFQIIVNAMLLGTLGLLIQGAEQAWLIILGRCIYGWAMFQATVRLEVMLFEISTPNRYATDFSKMHFMQNLGVIAASFSVGSIVVYTNYSWTFYIASFGFMTTLAIFYFSFRPKREAISYISNQAHES